MTRATRWLWPLALLTPLVVGTLLVYQRLAEPDGSGRWVPDRQAQLRADEPPDDGLGPIGQLGGSAAAVAVRDGRAFVGVGRRLIVVDVAGVLGDPPLHGRQRGQSPALDDAVRAVALVGDTAWLAAGQAGLVAVDITRPEALQVRASLPTEWAAYDVAVDSERSLAFVAEGARGLRIVDIGDPSAPIGIATFSDALEARAVAVSAGRAYVADWGVGVTVLDTTDATNPQTLGRWPLDEAADVAVAGERLLVADRARGLLVLDVARPSLPRLLGERSIAGTAERLAIEPGGGHAWLAAREGGLQLLDLTTPEAPRVLSTLATTTIAWDVALDDGGTKSIVTGQGEAPLAFVADVGAYTPSQPGFGGGSWEAGHIWGVEVQAPQVRGFSGLRMVSRDDDGRLRQLGVHLSPGFVESVSRVAHDGPLLLADGYAGLVLADALTPERPRVLGSRPTRGAAHALAVDGQRAYVADGPAGVAAYDLPTRDEALHQAAAPLERWRVDTPGEALGVAAHAGLVYVADGPSGLRVIDAVQGREIAQVALPGYAWDVATAHGHAWVSARQGGLRILSLRDPRAPHEVAAVLADRAVVFQTVFDQRSNIAWVAAGPTGVVALDVAQPMRPREIGRWSGSGAVVGLALDLARERAYAAAGGGGLVVLDIRDPATPRLERAWALPGIAERVLLHAGVAYVATERGGLQLVRVHAPPAHPQARRLLLPWLER